MLEGYTTLGYLAACTSRATLVTLVTGTVYREPGVLGKIVTTLDVLSGGRAWLGIGAAWNEEESRGLGIAFPPVAERFERLEETLQICLQMWHGDERPYQGRHYQLARPLNCAAVTVAAAPADHDRRRRREEDAAPGGAVRRRLQPVRRAGGGQEAGRAARALRGGRPGLRHGLQDGRTTRSTRPRARSASSTSSARWPAWASTPRSDRWPASGTSRRWRSSAPRSSRSSPTSSHRPAGFARRLACAGALLAVITAGRAGSVAGWAPAQRGTGAGKVEHATVQRGDGDLDL